jgi:hypothetical protein
MLEEKGDSTRGIKRQLLMLYCRNKDVEKAEPLVKVMNFIWQFSLKFTDLLTRYWALVLQMIKKIAAIMELEG